MDAIVMAAGEGRRMRPVTERWPKPILPVDGRPVIATVLRELAAAGCEDVSVVTGHLAEQVQTLVGDGSGFGVRVRYARQPQADGSADAVRRALAAGARLPAIVVGADTVFAPGSLARFRREAEGAPGAIAARPGQPGSGGKRGIGIVDGRVTEVESDDATHTSAPLWYLGPPLEPLLDDLPGPPFELRVVFLRALDAGLEVRGVVVPGTRDITDSLDLMRENFPYLP